MGTVGEPGRRPIVAWAQEVGFDYEGLRWDLSIGAFRLDVSNERILDPVTRAISSSGSSVRQGLDVFGRIELGRGLALQGGATWNDARLSGGYADPHEDHGHGHEHEHTHAAPAAAGEVEGKLRPTRSAFHQRPAHDHDSGGERVPGVARYTANVAAEADLMSGIWLRGGWRFTGPYAPIGEPDIRTRAYAIADLSVHVPLARATELNVELQNVFGRRYPEIRASGFISPGAPRTLRLGMNFLPPR